MRRLWLGILGMDDRPTAILVHKGSTSAGEPSARTLDRLEINLWFSSSIGAHGLIEDRQTLAYCLNVSTGHDARRTT